MYSNESHGNETDEGNKNKSSIYNDTLLTSNITRIDIDGLVTVKFNYSLDNYMFNITRTDYTNPRIGRYLKRF